MMFMRWIGRLVGGVLLGWVLMACEVDTTAVSPLSTSIATVPSPTLQAAVAGSSYLTPEQIAVVETLQTRPWGSGQLMLYRWTDETDTQAYLAAAYLTKLNNEWQAHDTATAVYTNEHDFMVAYTWNSRIEAPFGPPRDTAVFGTSPHGRAVRIVWSDGQVTHIPLHSENGSFLDSRPGKWQVERIELLGEDNQLLQAVNL